MKSPYSLFTTKYRIAKLPEAKQIIAEYSQILVQANRAEWGGEIDAVEDFLE